MNTGPAFPRSGEANEAFAALATLAYRASLEDRTFTISIVPSSWFPALYRIQLGDDQPSELSANLPELARKVLGLSS